jgi:hypothetical protein
MRSNHHQQGYAQGYKIRSLEVDIVESEKHHIFKRDDGNGQVYCSDCGTRDFDELSAVSMT